MLHNDIPPPTRNRAAESSIIPLKAAVKALEIAQNCGPGRVQARRTDGKAKGRPTVYYDEKEVSAVNLDPGLVRTAGLHAAQLIGNIPAIRTQRISVACQKPIELSSGCRSFSNCAVSSLLSVSERTLFPRLRIQVVHGTVPQECARIALPAALGVLSRQAPVELHSHPLPLSSKHVPEAIPN